MGHNYLWNTELLSDFPVRLPRAVALILKHVRSQLQVEM